MESTVKESDGRCACEIGPSLAVLNDVHKAYEEKMDLINQTAGSQKLQKQVQLLQSWVGDLVAQNTLLARTVEELEIELTSRVLSERRKFSEKDKSKNVISEEVNELKINIDSLQRDNLNKEREIRKLSKEVQQHEQTISSLRNDISMSKYHTPDVSRKDAAVTVEICCSANKECGDVEPVKEGSARDEEVQYQERIQHMESSGQNVRALREVNVSLSEEVQALHRVCAALDEQCRVSALRAQFKDEIIREMRRQLKWAKAKLKESDHKSNTEPTSSQSYGSVRRSNGRERDLPDLDMNPDWICQNRIYDGSGDVVSYGRD
ncbi:centrosome-associated protein CEP250-like isoform X1 [Pieris brassicae]|uniref:centrosome-associated protein CEP250-like isoform X1 n=1 Tax=Pieris brassicae TaxID=7116 RepID=UPI001E65F42B|nr:centrosome-associated protein CEP250-like isoform X1 [Pieris brassicae]